MVYKMTFKKIFLAIFSALLLIGLAGCVGQKDLASTVSQQAYNYEIALENGKTVKGGLYFGSSDKNQGYYRKFEDTISTVKPTFDGDVKKYKNSYTISKAGDSISLDHDGSGDYSGVGSDVAPVTFKNVKIDGEQIKAKVFYRGDDYYGDITLTPVKE